MIAATIFIDDGRWVVAGQQISDDPMLDQITPTGVVVEFRGYLIEVGVLQNWSFRQGLSGQLSFGTEILEQSLTFHEIQ